MKFKLQSMRVITTKTKKTCKYCGRELRHEVMDYCYGCKKKLPLVRELEKRFEVARKVKKMRDAKKSR